MHQVDRERERVAGRPDRVRLRPAHGAGPVAHGQPPTPVPDDGRLQVSAYVDPLDADVALMGARDRETDRIAVRRVDQLDTPALRDGRASGRSSHVGLDDQHPPGARVPFELQVGQTVETDIPERAERLLEDLVVATLLAGRTRP